jgi:YHS domain-containing protein
MKLATALGLLALLGCPRAAPVGYAEPPADGTLVKDPVSGEACEKTPLTEAAVYRDQTYYFCGPNRLAFVATPDAFVR